MSTALPDKKGFWWGYFDGDYGPLEVESVMENGRSGLAIYETLWDTDGLYFKPVFVDDSRLEWGGRVYSEVDVGRLEAKCHQQQVEIAALRTELERERLQ